GGRRRVGLVGGTGHWYKSGRGLVPIRWVSVRDLDGTHRDEFFYTTDTKLTAAEVVSHYTARWNMETTFQQLRSHLGLESTRGWCGRTVLRAAPCLFGLYTVVALLYQLLPAERRGGGISWPGKATVTFSDALVAVRRWLWADAILPQVGASVTTQKLPDPIQELLFSALAPNI